jgi:hypothetical protein
MPETASRTSSMLKRLVALVVLVVAGIILVRAVVGFLSGLFVVALVIAALVAVIWAYGILKRR